MSSNSDNKRGNPLGTDGYEFVEFTAPDAKGIEQLHSLFKACLLYTSPSPRDGLLSRMPSSA